MQKSVTPHWDGVKGVVRKEWDVLYLTYGLFVILNEVKDLDLW